MRNLLEMKALEKTKFKLTVTDASWILSEKIKTVLFLNSDHFYRMQKKGWPALTEHVLRNGDGQLLNPMTVMMLLENDP